jgi:tetratricopeptide (TPR) repeat protein
MTKKIFLMLLCVVFVWCFYVVKLKMDAQNQREIEQSTIAAELSEQAQSQYEMENWSGALETVELALDHGAGGQANRELKALCLLRLGQPQEAASWLEHWLRAEPNHPEALYLRGLAALDSRDFQAATGFLHQALQAGAREKDQAHRLLADTYMHLGLEARNAGDPLLAVQEMEVAVNLDPENGPFHHALGKAYLSLKRWPEALDALDLAHTHGVVGTQALTSLLDDLCTAHHELAAVALLEGRNDVAFGHASQGLDWVTTVTARERLKGLRDVARQKWIRELKAQARVAQGVAHHGLWHRVLLLEPADAEALWEVSRGDNGPQKKQVERMILAGPWGVEARLRLAEEAGQAGREDEKLRLLAEAWQISHGLERLLLEEKLFDMLEHYPDPPVFEPWRLVWRWRLSEQNFPVWLELSPQVEKVLPERWYLWLYRAQKYGQNQKWSTARKIFDEIAGFDPPERGCSRLQSLQNQLNHVAGVK